MKNTHALIQKIASIIGILALGSLFATTLLFIWTDDSSMEKFHGKVMYTDMLICLISYIVLVVSEKLEKEGL